MEILATMIFFIVALGLVGYLLQLWSIRKILANSTERKINYREENFDKLPGISVLKPLKGLDDNLFDNLESICNQDYPEYEIIFSLQDCNDPALKVAEKIKEKYPEKKITLLIEKCKAGLNPKINNLIPAYRIAKHDYILISDSNVMVSKNYLKEIIKPFANPETGLVTNLIKGMGGYTLGSIFENLHLNSFVIGSMCFLDRFLRMPCVVGKSMLMKKKDIEAIGGLESVKDVLAEDYILGKKIYNLGKKVVLSNHIINNINNYWGLRQFLNRHSRWGKLRWHIGGIKYFSELLSNPVFLSIFPIIFTPSTVTISFAVFVCSLKVIGDMLIGRAIKTDMNSFLFLLSPLKDLVIGITWFIPLLNNKISWRGNRYIISHNSQLLPCPEKGVFYHTYRFLNSIKTRFA